MSKYRASRGYDAARRDEAGRGRVLLLSLPIGARFRFSKDGPDWTVVELPDGRRRYREGDAGTPQIHDAALTTVYPIPDPTAPGESA